MVPPSFNFFLYRTNAVALPRLLANENEPMGHALFPIFSIIAHNCGANCRYVCSKDGRTVTVRAMRKISKGEDLTIDYKDPLIGNFVRMPWLQMTSYAFL